jgi:hypothetical protein
MKYHSCLAFQPSAHSQLGPHEDVAILVINPSTAPNTKCIVNAPYGIESDT